MSGNEKITVENMNLHYGKFHALKNINMAIPEKEITAFIGPSGCGKSTLLKSLNRMNDLVEGCSITGKVELDGEDIYLLSKLAILEYLTGGITANFDMYLTPDTIARASEDYGFRTVLCGAVNDLPSRRKNWRSGT